MLLYTKVDPQRTLADLVSKHVWKISLNPKVGDTSNPAVIFEDFPLGPQLFAGNRVKEFF